MTATPPHPPAVLESHSAYPVVYSTGAKILSETDFALPGAIPLNWSRFYRSTERERNGWLGHGWTVPYAVELRLSASAILFFDERNRQISWPLLAEGEAHFDVREGLTLKRETADRYVLQAKDGECRIFDRRFAGQWRLPLSALEDRHGNALRFDYPATPQTGLARPDRIHDADGRTLWLTWGQYGLEQVRLTAVAANDGIAARLDDGPRHSPFELILARYHYAAAGDLERVELPGGAVWRYTYDAEHRLVAYTNPLGMEYRQEWQGERVVRSIAADGSRELRLEFAARQTRVTDATGATSTYLLNERDEVIGYIDPLGEPIASPFNPNGRPAAETDPLGRSTRYQYDARGNLTELTDAAGQSTRLQYDANDRPVELIDPMGQSWRYQYDGQGNPHITIDPLQQTTRLDYDERGRVIRIVDAKGGSKLLAYDRWGNLATYTDCSGYRTQFEHDPLGRLLAVTDAEGQTARYRYDAAGRLAEAIEPDGASHHYHYDPAGNLIAYRDPLGHTTHYRYDGHGQPIERIDGLGHRLRYDYDRAGQLLALINENGDRYHFHYDAAGQLIEEIGFDGRLQRYQYNAAGELTHLIEAGGSDAGPGKITHFERDKLGRLLRKRHDDDSSAEYDYDPLGRLIAARNPAASLAFRFDPLGQLLEESQTHADGHTFALKHRYDPLGNRLGTQLPDGRQLDWLYYGSGHLHGILLDGQALADFERDKLHRETRRQQGLLSSHSDYDPAGRLLRQRAMRANGSEVLRRDYLYDRAGQLTRITDRSRGEINYRYDPLGQLLAAERYGPQGLQAEQFAFDPAHNLLPANEHGRAWGQVEHNQLYVFQDLRYQYDQHGNMVERRKGSHTTQHFTYDADHQLTQAQVERHGVSQTTHYRYDPLGRRIAKQDAFGTTYFGWDGDRMSHEQRGSKQTTYLYEPASFVPLAKLTDNEVYHYQTDHLGTPLELTDQYGYISWRAEYRAWGNTLKVEEVATDQPLRFQGQYFDTETGLHYNRFRYYDPEAGRFVTQDPIGLNGDDNVYAYVASPSGWLDPLGLGPRPNRGGNGNNSGGNQNQNKAPPCQSRAMIQRAVQNVMAKYKPQIQALDPQAKVGYRGSLARGRKGPHKGGGPFTPTDFDIDAFIVSDKLKREGGWGSDIKEVIPIQEAMDAELRKIPCLGGMRSDKFGFKIFSSAEMKRTINLPDEVQVRF